MRRSHALGCCEWCATVRCWATGKSGVGDATHGYDALTSGCHPSFWGGGGGANIRKEEGGGGRGSGTQKFVYQKWPNQIFPFVNFVFPHDGHFGLGGGASGSSYGSPPFPCQPGGGLCWAAFGWSPGKNCGKPSLMPNAEVCSGCDVQTLGHHCSSPPPGLPLHDSALT